MGDVGVAGVGGACEREATEVSIYPEPITFVHVPPPSIMSIVFHET